tara:strand:- start:160 stop:441 length:282 start_codon:yes stop_codon:yes gene_type:complete
MAQNTDIVIVANVWTQLTNTNVSLITFQNKGTYHILVKGTTGASAPTDDNGSIRYNPGQGERNVPLSDLFSGINAVRVWAYGQKELEVMVSHV